MEHPSPSAYPTSDYFMSPDFMQYPSASHYEMQLPTPAPASPRLNFNSLNSLNLSTGLPYYPPTYAHQSRGSPRPFSPTQSISPPLTNMSASDLSGDGGMPSGSRSSGTGSPASSHGGNLVHRQPLRHNSSMGSSTASGYGSHVSSRDRRRRKTEDDFGSDDDEPMPQSTEVVVTKRREEIRRQRIESEQRRRDELRDGYRRLKDVLPVSNQKSSKVSLLDRATTHIKYLEMSQTQMMAKINELEAETNRLRSVNETLMLSAAERRNSLPSANF